MTVVSRLQLNHPALGAAGGSGLHTSIEALYTKIGNNLSTRILTAVGLANAATATVQHDLQCAFSDLRYDLYLYNTGTTEITRITDFTSPAISAFTIVATSGFLTTKIDITNNSGSSQDLALVVDLDPIEYPEIAVVKKAVSSNITLVQGRVHLVDTTAARTLTLPNPATTKAPIWVKDSTGTANVNPITIARFASESIETVAASFVLDSDLGAWQIVTDGTNWFLT